MSLLILTLLLLWNMFDAYDSLKCGPKNIICVSPNAYQVCVNVGGNYVLVGGPTTCPNKYYCSENGQFPCVSTAPPPAPRPPPSPAVLPQCFGPSTSAGPGCGIYFECVMRLWWWEPVMRRCPGDFAFNQKKKRCSTDLWCPSEADLPFTTTAPTAIVRPKCTGPSRHPHKECGRYYRCVQKLWWFEPELAVCPNRSVFSPELADCLPEVKCNSTGTTTSPTWLAPTSVPVNPPSCSGANNVSTPQCGKYYECVPKLWWWEPIQRICPADFAFDASTKLCSADKKCYRASTATSAPASELFPTSATPKHPIASTARSAGTTLLSTARSSISISSSVPTTPDQPSSNSATFTSASKAASSSWTAKRRNATTISPETPTSKSPPVAPPTCSGSGKFPANKCNEYFECVQKLWWWEPALKSCPSGTGFSGSTKNCLADVKCHG